MLLTYPWGGPHPTKPRHPATPKGSRRCRLAFHPAQTRTDLAISICWTDTPFPLIAFWNHKGGKFKLSCTLSPVYSAISSISWNGHTNQGSSLSWLRSERRYAANDDQRIEQECEQMGLSILTLYHQQWLQFDDRDLIVFRDCDNSSIRSSWIRRRIRRKIRLLP